MNIVIEQAGAPDAATISAILQESARWLIENDRKLWDLSQLSVENLRNQVEDGMFWLAKVDGAAAGCVRFQLSDEEYWGDIPHEDSAFVHRLAVRRKFAGQGISKALIDWAKAKAGAEGRDFLRLDCADRESLRRIYENYGFEFHSFKEREPYKVARYQFRIQPKIMLKEAVSYYHELLKDEELSEASRRFLDEGLEKNRLIFGGRRLSPYLRPHFVTETDWIRVVAICETIWSALQKVKDAAIGNDALLDELGITEIEKDLVSIDPKYRQVSPTARLDSFLTENAYSFVELNGESPAGIAFADSATEIFQNLPVMKKFAEKYEVRGFEGSSKMLDVLLRAYGEFLGADIEKAFDAKPTIAIVDLKDLPTVKEFELFRDYFESKGYTSVICSPDELEFDGEKLYFGSVKIDIVYKRLLVNEYLPIMNECPDLLNAYRAGAVCMVNSFQSKIIHKKAVFAVLTNEKYAHLFSEEELNAIHAHVPWTRKFREESTVNKGENIDLVEWTRANKSKLVLKPNDDYGGHGIYIGWISSDQEWEEAIKAALADGDYLVQERVETSKEVFPMLFGDLGEIKMIEQLVDLDPLLYYGKVGSAFTRLSSSELANVSSGGGMVPTFIIREKDKEE